MRSLLIFLTTITSLAEGLHVDAATGAKMGLADKVIESSKKRSEELLNEVHEQIRSLTSDLDQSAAEQKKDLDLLKQDEAFQDRALENTESKLKDIAAEKIAIPEAVMSSFMQNANGQGDFIAPLRKAAEKAREFAEKLMNSSVAFARSAGGAGQPGEGKNSSSSFLEAKDVGYFLGDAASLGTEDPDTDAAERGLSLAQDGISTLDADIAAQKKMLATERDELEKEKESTAKLDLNVDSQGSLVASSDTPQVDPLEDAETLPGLSFLETQSGASSAAAAASRARLSSWLQRFRAKLNKARAAAGLPALPVNSTQKVAVNKEEKRDERTKGSSSTEITKSKEKESLLQWAPLNFAESEDMQKEKRDVARLKEEFAESLQKVKDQSAALLAESQADLEANEHMKSTLDDGSISSGSFVETSSFDPQKEAAAIKELNRRWEAEADKLKNAPIGGPEEEELSAMMKQQKERDARDDEKIKEMKDEMRSDLQKLHKEISLATANTANEDFSSFLEIGHRNPESERAKSLLNRVEDFVVSDEIKTKAELQSLRSEAANAVGAIPGVLAEVARHIVH